MTGEQADHPRGRDRDGAARRADPRHDVLAGVGGTGPRRPAGQLDPAGRRVPDRPRQDHRRRRDDGPRRQREAKGRRKGPLLPPLPAARARSAHRRLLDHGPLPGWARSVAERLPDRVEHQPEHRAGHDVRQAQGHDDPGQRPAPDAPARCPASRLERARRQVRSGSRDRAEDGPRPRRRVEPDLRPEPDRGQLRGSVEAEVRLSAPPEPRRGRPLHARARRSRS